MVNRADMEAYDRVLNEMDPEAVEAAEAQREAQKRRAGLIASQGVRDARELMLIPAFRRYFFTVLARAGIYAASRHALEGDYAYDAGRRALGLELQVELLGIDPKFAIDLSVEQAKLEEMLRDDPSQ